MNHRAEVENQLRPQLLVKGRDWRSTLSERMAHYRVPGVSIAVINEGQIEWAAGYGKRSWADPRPIAVNTLFQAASISKVVTAATVMTLIEEGLADLDQDINNFLTSCSLPMPAQFAEVPVTLRRILSHTAGLSVHGFLGYEPDGALPTLAQILDGVPPAQSEAVRVTDRPGSLCRYSGGGTTLATLLVEDVLGCEFAAAAATRVLDPLGLADSFYAALLPAERAEQVALGNRHGQVLETGYRAYPELGPDGLWSTPTEIARFALGLAGCAAGRRSTPLGKASAQQMLQAQAGASFANGVFGLGPLLHGEHPNARFGHSGFNAGYMCEFIADVSGKQGVVVMTNADEGAPLLREIIYTVAEVYDWTDYRRPAFIEVPCSPAELQRYAGNYTFFEGGLDGGVRFEASGSDLICTLSAGFIPPTPVVPVGQEEFVFMESPHRVRFDFSGGAPLVSLLVDGMELFKGRRDSF